MSFAETPSRAPLEAGSLVSVIIPFYSHPEYLPQALESALGQLYTHLEIIVVDDGSPHDLNALLQPYGGDERLRVIRQPNAGVAAARNTGIQASRGAYFQFLDSDDWLAPEKISRHVTALDARPEIGLVFCPFHFVEEGVVADLVDPAADPFWRAEDGRYFNTLWAANRMVVAGPLIRREWILRANGFDTSNLTEDYELWLRLAALGCVMQSLPEALVYYRVNKQGRSQDGRARARKVATRARIFSLFPELAAEATERAMDVWLASFNDLWRDRQVTIDQQTGQLAEAQRVWDELLIWSQEQQRIMDLQAGQLTQARQELEEVQTRSLEQQHLIAQQVADLEQTRIRLAQLQARTPRALLARISRIARERARASRR